MDTESSKTYFFLPSTTDRIEEINHYVNSVNLISIDIHQNEFEVDGFKNVVNLSNSNLQKNTNAFLATKSH